MSGISFLFFSLLFSLLFPFAFFSKVEILVFGLFSLWFVQQFLLSTNQTKQRSEKWAVEWTARDTKAGRSSYHKSDQWFIAAPLRISYRNDFRLSTISTGFAIDCNKAKTKHNSQTVCQEQEEKKKNKNGFTAINIQTVSETKKEWKRVMAAGGDDNQCVHRMVDRH